MLVAGNTWALSSGPARQRLQDALEGLNIKTRRYDSIVLHHSASKVDNYASIREFHVKKRGWSDAAYHLILSNGSTSVPPGHLEGTSRFERGGPAAATRSWRANRSALHLCVVGDYQEHEMSAELKTALVNALTTLMKKYELGPEDIRFHRDVNLTLCPGRFMSRENLAAWLREYGGQGPAEIAAQHESVLGLNSDEEPAEPAWLPAAMIVVVSSAETAAWGAMMLLASAFSKFVRRRRARPAEESASA
jgi:hypothetical protein